MTGYTWLWLGWFACFAAVEGVGALPIVADPPHQPDARRRDAFQHVSAWFGAAKGTKAHSAAWVRRVVLALFLAWLSMHFLGWPPV